MGKRIKSSGIIMDASSTGSAPVSPAGTVALRAKSDSTQFQYSANGGAWTDFGGSSVGTVRLDQVLDPNIPPEVPPVNRVKAFSMTDHSLVFGFDGTQSEECFVIGTSEPVTPGAAGSILLLRASGATTEKNPLRIETRGTFAFTVAATGKVAMGAETAIDHRLNIYQINTGTDNSGLIYGGCTMFVGNTATSVKAVQFQLDDTQDTASLLSMQTMELQMSRTAGVANTNVTATTLVFDINISRTTKTVRGLSMSMSSVGTLTITDWEGIRITAPATVGSVTITNKRAIITESGAGNVGFGTLTPSAQLHVSGTVRLDLGSDATGDIFYRSSGGNLTRLAVGTNGHVLTLASGLPSWAAAGAGSGTPGGASLELQYNNAGAFGGIPDAHVDVAGGSNIILPAYLQIRAGTSLNQEFFISATTAAATRFLMRSFRNDNAAQYIQFDRGRGTEASKITLSDGDPVGRIQWSGYLGGTPTLTELGYLLTHYETGFGGVVTLAARDGDNVRLSMQDNVAVNGTGSATLIAGTHAIQVQMGGIRLSGGAQGSIYYQNDVGGFLFFTPLAAGTTSQYLKGGTVPSWGSLDAGHITAGTLPLARGGTGSSLSDPGSADRIMFWDDSANVVTWLEAGSGLSISGTTMTASGGTPGGSTYDVQYRTATPSFGGITQVSGGLLMGTSGAPPFFTATFASGIRYTYSPSSTIPGLNVGSLASGSNPSAPANGDIYYNSTAGKFRAYQAGAWVDMCSPAGSGSELQYRNAGAFGAVSSSSVDGSGVVTFGSGRTIWNADGSNAQLSMNSYNSTAASGNSISILRSRGSVASKSAVLSGDALFSMAVSGQYDSAGQRQGGQLGFDAAGNYSTSSAPTVFRVKTSHVNSITPNERMVLGGSLTLVDNTLTNLFSVTFAAADQKIVGGEIHMIITAKQVSGSVQTQVYHRKMHFVFGHNGATNSSAVDIRLDSGVGANEVNSFGGISQLQHAINSSGATNMTSAITLGTLSDTLTYKVLFNSDITTFSQFTLYYHIIYHGEADIVLA